MKPDDDGKSVALDLLPLPDDYHTAGRDWREIEALALRLGPRRNDVEVAIDSMRSAPRFVHRTSEQSQADQQRYRRLGFVERA